MGMNTPSNKEKGGMVGIVALVALVVRYVRGENRPFPERIGEYRFIKEFYHPRRVGRYSFAIYIDASGRKAFAKRWQGWFHDIEYIGLKSDANVLQIISKVFARTRGKDARMFADVGAPEYLGFFEDSSSATLLMEYAEGILVGQLSASRRVAALNRAMAF